MASFMASAYPGNMILGGVPSISPVGRTVVVAPGSMPYTVNLVESSVLNRFQPVARSHSSPTSVKSQEPRQPRVRRTFKELSRELECPHEDCKRRYASRSSLATHLRLKHSPEAKQQQEEDAQRQAAHRRRSLEIPVTPRPVRPRAIGVSPMEMLRRQTICGTLPLAVYSLPASPMGSPSVPMQMPLSAHSVVDFNNFSTANPTLEQSFSQPLVYNMHSSLHGSVASGMSSPILSSASTPTLSFVHSPSADTNLTQPIQADVLDELLLSHLNFNLASLDSSSKLEEHTSSLLSDLHASMAELRDGASTPFSL
jgi:hypothetical protein